MQSIYFQRTIYVHLLNKLELCYLDYEHHFGQDNGRNGTNQMFETPHALQYSKQATLLLQDTVKSP